MTSSPAAAAQPIHTDLLIVGAGPFGLALAILARERGTRHVLVGRFMEFWQRHMPAGMLLRSDCEWHLDPLDRYTIDAYLGELGRTRAQVEPLTLPFYLDYAEWLRAAYRVEPVQQHIVRLDRA